MQRSECDGCLKDLAIILPRANLGPDEIERMLDLYFGLLREAHVTKPMLVRASKAFVMAPKKGKARWFPDPGELYEMVADEAASRRQKLTALVRALEVLDGKLLAAPETEGPVVEDVQARLRALGEKMAAKKPIGPVIVERTPQDPAIPHTARAATDVSELRATLATRLNAA